ncbi:MAG: hypothetical protein EAZ97_06130 [Bacteroidetes bacterium]|nr:MAG: hypothetical protein EAZ97_06130 [Bacteroidota bacterium]
MCIKNKFFYVILQQHKKKFMAKRRKNIAEEDESVSKNWKEGELIETFKLNRINKYQTPLMQEWLEVSMPVFDAFEQVLFDRTYEKGMDNMSGWNEEDLKMKFITHILDLGHFYDEGGVIGYFDKTISAVVEDTKLTVKSDFMMAKGILDAYETPFFHFQEYKPYKNPSGDSMAQLLEAFMIAQVKNKNEKPLYGLEIMRENWIFVVMENKNYCISESFSALKKEELLKIISVLRKFKHILMNRLLD